MNINSYPEIPSITETQYKHLIKHKYGDYKIEM